MELRYMGFDQENGTRTYRFDRVAKGEPKAHLVIAAPLDLFLKYGVAIQDGPVLCARKLTEDLERQFTEHTLTTEDMVAFTADRAESDARRAEARQGRRRTARATPYAGGSLPSTPFRV